MQLPSAAWNSKLKLVTGDGPAPGLVSFQSAACGPHTWPSNTYDRTLRRMQPGSYLVLFLCIVLACCASESPTDPTCTTMSAFQPPKIFLVGT